MAEKSKSKFFRVAVEGGTSDGRVIDRSWIEQMAATYNPTTYGARVNCEHLRGFSPAAPFNAYGDVLAVKAEPVELQIGGKTETRLALYAQIEPNEQLLATNKLGQKIYTSVEISPKFGGTDKAYLVGLAITDSPASLGTEILAFAAANPAASPFASRKQAADNLFTAAIESQIDLDGQPNPVNPDPTGIFAALKGFVTSLTKAPETPVTPPAQEKPTPANDNAQLTAVIATLNALPGTLEAMQKASSDGLASLRTDLTALKTQLATTEGPGLRRPEATGGGKFAATDC